MNKAYGGVGNPTNEFLGAGAIYFNWGLVNETYIGATKGGGTFTDNAEFREREADQDYAPVKGHRNLVKMTPQLTVPGLKLSVANLVRFIAGAKTDTSTAGQTKIVRSLDLSGSYIDNVAFVGANREGKLMVVVVKNALADGAFNIPATPKEEEIVISPQFTGHIDELFDPDDISTYPYEIIMDTSVVTFTVNDNLAAPLENAVVKLNGEYGVTDASGEVVFNTDKGTAVRYTVEATGFVTATGTITIDDDVEAQTVQLELPA